jgi:hypothetical protein
VAIRQSRPPFGYLCDQAVCLWGQDVNLHQGIAGSVVLAGNDGGRIAERPRNNNGRLMGIGRRKAAGLDFSLLRVLPIVVRQDQRPITIPQLEHRIGQDIGNIKLR